MTPSAERDVGCAMHQRHQRVLVQDCRKAPLLDERGKFLDALDHVARAANAVHVHLKGTARHSTAIAKGG